MHQRSDQTRTYGTTMSEKGNRKSKELDANATSSGSSTNHGVLDPDITKDSRYSLLQDWMPERDRPRGSRK